MALVRRVVTNWTMTVGASVTGSVVLGVVEVCRIENGIEHDRVCAALAELTPECRE